MTPRKLPRRSRAGFTLFEILIVLALIGLLATFLVVNLGGEFMKAEQDIAKTWVTTTLSTPLWSFKRDMGRFPTTAEGIAALIRSPQGEGASNWNGPYLRVPDVPLDPWKKPYQYRNPGTKGTVDGYDVFSSGKDGVPDTADDIGNWN